MSTIALATGAVRRKLDFPDEATLPDGVIGEWLIDVIDPLVTELGQTDQTWFIGSCNIDVVADEDSYSLEVADGYGKARYVWTKDDADSSHRRRNVPIVNYEYLTTLYGAGDPNGLADSIEHSAQACSIIYDINSATNRIVFAPIPSQDAQYRFVYQVDVVRGQTEGDTAFRLRQFDSYVSDLGALGCLIHAKWNGLNDEQTARKKAELERILLLRKMEGDDLFRRAKWSNKNSNSFARRGFGQRRWGR